MSDDEKGVEEHLASVALSIYAAGLSTLRQDHNFHPLNQRRINLQDIQIRRGSPLAMINASSSSPCLSLLCIVN